jgi:hypothetical protein
VEEGGGPKGDRACVCILTWWSSFSSTSVPLSAIAEAIAEIPEEPRRLPSRLRLSILGLHLTTSAHAEAAPSLSRTLAISTMDKLVLRASCASARGRARRYQRRGNWRWQVAVGPWQEAGSVSARAGSRATAGAPRG